MFSRQPCKDFLKYLCTNSLCDYLHPPECQFNIHLNRDVNSVKSVRLHTGRLKVNPAKNRKRMVTKVQWFFCKDVRQLGCVFQDTEPPESLSILRKSTKVLGSIRRVRFTEATQRHANIRENKGSSLGKFKSKFLISAVPTL